MIQLIFLAVNFPAFGVSTATQPFQVLMKVNNKGYIANGSLPACNSSERIKLLSYCATGHRPCNTSVESNLSPATKRAIHKMCSLKTKCDNTKFPWTDLQHSRTTEINVTYSCLDQFAMFVDICASTTKEIDDPIHLIYRHAINNSAKYETCSCLINGIGGNFSMAVADLRLNSDKTCTRSQLYTYYQTFSCNDTMEDYGSVLLQTEKANMSENLVKLDTGHSTVEPEMMYLTIKPQAKVQLSCQNRPRKAAPYESSAFDKTGSIDQDTTSSMTATIASVCGCAVALVLVSVAVFIKYRSRNLKSRKWNLERLIERHIQHPRDESNSGAPAQCITDDDYVELKKKNNAPEYIKYNAAGSAKPSDSYYDPVNNPKPVLSKDDTSQVTKDSSVYSYAEHQPENRMITATQYSSHKADDRKFPRVDGISNGDNAMNKHVYVKLLPVQETAAGECLDSVQSDAGMEMKGLSNNNRSDVSHLKNTGFFKGSEVNENQSTYSFAKEPYQARTNPLFDSQNPEEPMTHSGQNQYDTTTAIKMKAIPCHNYDHAKKPDNSETSCASDDEHYDRVDGDRIPVQINPNYDKLSK